MPLALVPAYNRVDSPRAGAEGQPIAAHSLSVRIHRGPRVASRKTLANDALGDWPGRRPFLLEKGAVQPLRDLSARPRGCRCSALPDRLGRRLALLGLGNSDDDVPRRVDKGVGALGYTSRRCLLLAVELGLLDSAERLCATAGHEGVAVDAGWRMAVEQPGVDIVFEDVSGGTRGVGHAE